MHQAKTRKTYAVAEFFCGCGGFSRGFTRSGRFRSVLGNDIKREALSTFAFNHQSELGGPAIIAGDIRNVGLESVAHALATRSVRPGELDCLIGGPPCQGFSQLRRSEERRNGKIVKFRGYSKLANDPRNDLVLRFLELAEFLKPKILVIENVPQMLRHGHNGRLGQLTDTVVEMLERELGYSVAVSVLSAADYGVPQVRERAIFVASAVGPARLPAATHADHGSNARHTGLKSQWVTVQDAIGDLPPPSLLVDELGGRGINIYYRSKSEYATRLQSRTSFPWNHVTRQYSQQVLDIISEMKPGEDWDAAMVRMQRRYEEKIRRTASSTRTSRKVARERMVKSGAINAAFYKRYYWSAYTRLAWNSPALTITANANFLGSGRFTHPTEMRGITMREAARLQSFDDDFRFVTSSTDVAETNRIGVGLDMIGEAVPPILAEAIALEVASQLDQAQSVAA